MIVSPDSRVPSARDSPNAAKPANAAIPTQVSTFIRRDVDADVAVGGGDTGFASLSNDLLSNDLMTDAARAV